VLIKGCQRVLTAKDGFAPIDNVAGDHTVAIVLPGAAKTDPERGIWLPRLDGPQQTCPFFRN
jgi:hypothetical protein